MAILRRIGGVSAGWQTARAEMGLMDVAYGTRVTIRWSKGEVNRMPELARFQGMIIKLLYNDTVQHNKPHVHVYCGEYTASVGMDGELLAGSLPVKKLRLLEAWMIIHEEELYRAWNNAVRNKPFDKIDPLQ